MVIVGAGPAGLGPLFAAANVGRLDELLQNGVTILEQSHALGEGSLGLYAIRSDSSADAFLDIVVRTKEPRLLLLQAHPVTKALAAFGNGAAPLKLAADFLKLAGETLCRIVAESERGRVLLGVVVASVTQTSPSRWRTRFVHAASGVDGEVESTSVVLASGAHQPMERLWNEAVTGEPLLPRFAGKLLQSGDLFAQDGVERVTAMLRGRRDPRVVIVGGSTSAGAVAVSLLQRMPDIQFGEGGVLMLHRRPLRIFYESAGAALADGYTEFSADDICHLTARVYRLSGFRLDSRELIMGARGIGGRAPEPRLRLLQIGEENQEVARKKLHEADLIIAALGYRPRACRVFNASGVEVALRTPQGDTWALVDQECRVLRSDGSPLEGLFAIGLAVGPAASKELGGELNFRGQVNSLWMWQHTLGLRIVDGAFARLVEAGDKAQEGPFASAGVLRQLDGQHKAATKIPLIRPMPPTLSRHALDLAEIEASGTYSNYGPVNTRFEEELRTQLFHEGHCLTVCNATLGLMLAMREVLGEDRPSSRRYALMPSFTFAAAAQAALWCGLTPLLCDIDRATWLPSAEAEESLLEVYGEQVAVVVPYATFGNNLDLSRYRRMSDRYGVPIVVDAAASLGSLDDSGGQFGRGFEWPVVFSMHATKPFSTGEGGVIHCGDSDRIARLRRMGSFGFGEARSATMPGLNSKMAEVSALTALLQLRRFPEVVRHREILSQRYGYELNVAFVRQQQCGQRQSRAFESVLLPAQLAPVRARVIEDLRSAGIGSGTYFSPHLREQPYLKKHSCSGDLAVTEELAGRILSLPLLDSMTVEDVQTVVSTLREVTSTLENSIRGKKVEQVRKRAEPQEAFAGALAY